MNGLFSNCNCEEKTHLKQSWLPAFCKKKKKKSKIDKRLKQSFLFRRNRTKRANFRGSPLFQSTYNNKTEKQTISSTYLVSVGCGRLAEGKGHGTDWQSGRNICVIISVAPPPLCFCKALRASKDSRLKADFLAVRGCSIWLYSKWARYRAIQLAG